MSCSIFVSYAHDDYRFADQLVEQLTVNDFPVWLDRREIHPGQSWRETIELALKTSDVVLVLLSPRAVASDNVHEEITYARQKGKPVIPLLCERCDVPADLEPLHYVDFVRYGYKSAIEQLYYELKRAAIAVENPAGDKAPWRNPFAWGDDKSFCELIADAVEWAGIHGIIIMKDDKDEQYDLLELVEGMRFEWGFISPQFVVDDLEQSAVVKQPRLLLCDYPISNSVELEEILNLMAESGERRLALFAPEIEDEGRAVLLAARQRRQFDIVAVKIPGAVDEIRPHLYDIAVATRAAVISSEYGRTLASVGLKDLGRAEEITVTTKHTTVKGGHGNKRAIAQRVRAIYRQIEETFDNVELQERLGRLSGGTVYIQVGGDRGPLRSARKHALYSTHRKVQAALQEGVVPGAGVSLLKVRKKLKAKMLKAKKLKEGEYGKGIAVVQSALETPLREIAVRAGRDSDLVLKEVYRLQTEKSNSNIGLDPNSGAYVDVIKTGLLESSRLVRQALIDAGQLACQVLRDEMAAAQEG